MNKLKTTILTFALALSGAVAGATLAQPTVLAAGCSGVKCVTEGAGKAQTGNANTDDIPTLVQRVVNILLFILGAVAVIMIVIGGIKYTTSNGNAEQVKSAKNTVMYSIIGLIIAILAFAIVSFVTTSLTTASTTGGGGGGNTSQIQ